VERSKQPKSKTRRRHPTSLDDAARADAALQRRRSGSRASASRRPHGRRHYSVYVIELDPKARPGSSHDTPCVYVGMTGLPIGERLRNHLRGYKAARVVTRYGRRLLPELYRGLNPMAYDEAAAAEPRLAEALRQRGLVVFGGH
jgi:hypothetical protein